MTNHDGTAGQACATDATSRRDDVSLTRGRASDEDVTSRGDSVTSVLVNSHG